MFVIFGASGNTGRILALALLAQGKRVRAVGRRRDKLAALEAAGAEPFVADLENSAAVTEALRGAQAAYLLIPPNMTVDDVRAYQTRVVESVGRAVEGSQLTHAVLLSSVGADHASGTGPIAALHDFEARLNLVSALNLLVLRAGSFMTNLLGNLELMKSRGMNALPAPGTVSMGFVHPSDVGSYAAHRLGRLDFTGKSVVNVIGPKFLTLEEATVTLGRAVARTFEYLQVPSQAAQSSLQQAGLKPQMARMFVEMYEGAAKGLLRPQQGTSVVHTTTSIEFFAVTEFATAFRA